MLTTIERRHFIRHPICYPVEFEYAAQKPGEMSRTVNISEGGLLFLSNHAAEVGKVVVLKLPLLNRLFKVGAKVVHVDKDEENPRFYDIGVSFYRFSDAFKVKLIEQIYLIDEYRSLRSLQLGKEISFKDASREWIKRYSK
ncbi:MAG: PilZ domain-containing protein, partial [Candidatus Omnitrophica bacterium]|nr:PilZ domain-containing protein [Candidatus Omnitrophota bacterium]